VTIRNAKIDNPWEGAIRAGVPATDWMAVPVSAALKVNADGDSHEDTGEGIRILLGYHQALVRGALAGMLSRHGMTVVAELASTDDLAEIARLARPHVAVLDFMLPGAVTVSDLCATQTRFPLLIVLDLRSCANFGRSLAQLAPRVGLIGIDATATDLVDGVQRLVRGETVLDPELAVLALRSASNVLTRRERDVLRLAGQGLTAKEIATNLSLSTGTVRNYLSRILTKLGARTRIEALRIAQDAGWI
jgi:two-component system response regulator DesR